MTPDPHPGAGALAGLLRRLDVLHAHLWDECRATGEQDMRSLRAGRPDDGEEFDELVIAARAECITAGLRPGEYGQLLHQVGRVYRSMLACRFEPVPEVDRETARGREAVESAMRYNRAELRAGCHGYGDIRSAITLLKDDVSARLHVHVQRPGPPKKTLTEELPTIGRPRDPVKARIIKYALELRKQNESWKEISSAVHEKFGRRLSPSTLQKYCNAPKSG